MFVLFSLIVMRMSGGIVFHPIFGRTNYPARAKAALILCLSVMLYSFTGGTLRHVPETLLEYGVMLMQEFFFGFCLGFSTEIVFGTLRFATALIDFSMGLNMAQVFDPSSNTQATVSTGLFYGFLSMLFLVTGGHLRFLALLYRTAELVPFGEGAFRAGLPGYMLELFAESVRTGMQIAFPIVGIELLLEVALGILMRVIPQIHLFSINFQMKIIAGMLMLFFLLSPLGDRMERLVERAGDVAAEIIEMAVPLEGEAEPGVS